MTKIDIINESGVQIPHGLLAIYRVGPNEYAALCPLTDGEEPADADILICSCTTNEDNYELFIVDEKSEYQKAASAFKEVVESLLEV